METDLRGVNVELMGFDPGERDLPLPVVPIDEKTKARLARMLMAVVRGATPEENAGYLEDGFPPEVEELLRHPLEAEEFSVHVDMLVAVMQTPPDGD